MDYCRIPKRDRQDSQKLKNDTFCRLPVTSAQCIIGTGKYPGSGILLNYDDGDCSQGYAQIKEVFRGLIKQDILQPYKIDRNFISSKTGLIEVGYNLYVFDIRYQQNSTASQPIKVEVKFNGVVSNDINRYALVLTNKLVSVSRDWQRQYDLIYV